MSNGIIIKMFYEVQNAGRRGFTLIELLVVIAIIGILAAVIMASLSDAREDSLKTRALQDMRSIHTAMELMYNTTGLYPHKKSHYCPAVGGTLNEVDLSLGSSGLVATDGTYSAWNGPYIRNVIDPWGTPYFFDEDYYCTAGALGCKRVDSGTPDHSVLVSCGPDKMIGDDATNSHPNNGSACAYNDDNIVYVFCNN